jgi:hypothetical protein
MNPLSRTLLVVILLIAGATHAAAAQAAPPDNDGFAAATEVAGVPFSADIDLTEATTEPGEPFPCASVRGNVWYRLASQVAQSLRLTLISADSQVWAAAYRDNGSGLGGLHPINTCMYANQPWTLSLDAGDTVYVQVNSGFFAFAPNATLSIEPLAPPANDHFAAASRVESLPFSTTIDTSAATVEAGEPNLCTPPAAEKTVWYAFTPSESGSVMARISRPEPGGIAFYTGLSLGGLTQIACQYGFPLAVAVEAGKTYYIQVGLSAGRGAPLGFELEAAPPPFAGMLFFPSDPSVLDDIFFNSQSFDPAGSELSHEWDFGDGSSASGVFPVHRYAADGDYDVTLTVTTADGRQATASQVVAVRTHDVSILALDVPRSAKSGKTATITVGIGNTRYAESVYVQLLRSRAGGGFEFVAELTRDVPVMKAKKTTSFSFTYTFTDEDALAGRVSFQTTAAIVGARDAGTADNTAIAPATVVSR